MVVCLEQGADLHMAQLMPLPLTVCCFTKMEIGFTFLVPAHLPEQGPLNGCVCVCVCVTGQILFERDGKSSPTNYTHYTKLYPQNGERIVTIDAVTSFHRMYSELADNWDV